jgi:hypothetical protein
MEDPMRGLTLGTIVLLLTSVGCSLIVTKVPPVANAGGDVTVDVGTQVTFDGSLSFDPDGGKISKYEWQIVETPPGREEELDTVLGEVITTEVSWEANWIPEAKDVGQWVIRLRVTDDEGQTATDDVVATVLAKG